MGTRDRRSPASDRAGRFALTWDAGKTPHSRRYSIMKKNRSSAVRSDRPGRVGARRALAAPDAGVPLPTPCAPSDTTAQSGARTSNADAIDWRYLSPEEWPIVIDALAYYLSTRISTEARAPIERVREFLAGQA